MNAAVHTMSKADLCQAYGVTYGVLHRWLVPVVFSPQQYKVQRIFSPNQVRKIFDEIGPPIFDYDSNT
jgi:hypothetical protein